MANLPYSIFHDDGATKADTSLDRINRIYMISKLKFILLILLILSKTIRRAVVQKF